MPNPLFASRDAKSGLEDGKRFRKLTTGYLASELSKLPNWALNLRIGFAHVELGHLSPDLLAGVSYRETNPGFDPRVGMVRPMGWRQ